MTATASALAVSAEEPRAVASPPKAVPASQPGDLRRAPVPMCEPPFDDETADTADLDRPEAQGALALSFSLPGGLPVSPDAPAELSGGGYRRLQLVRPLEGAAAGARTPAEAVKPPSRRRRRNPDDDFGPRHTPRASLPEPRPWASRLVQAIVEVTSGVRPVSQLVRWTTTDVYATIQRRIAHNELLNQRSATGRRIGAIVRSIHVDEPADGVAEVCAVVQHGARCRAIALRLEGFDGRWQCTALQVG